MLAKIDQIDHIGRHRLVIYVYANIYANKKYL